MFADRLREKIDEDGTLGKLFEGARMVSIHEDVVATAMDLVARSDDKKFQEVSKYTCWPDHDTWLEFKWEGKDFGIYYHGDENSVLKGYALIAIDFKEDSPISWFPVSIDLESYHMQFCDIQKMARLKAERFGIDKQMSDMFLGLEPVEYIKDPLIQHTMVAPFIKSFKPILLTLLAFMNSPKLVRTREVDVARFNARRLKRGKYPYHPHHEVRLNIDKHDLNITQGQGDGPERCLHFVRAHMRFLVHPRYKNVSVVLVPPHYRGNPELGIMNTSYAVDRKNSKWKN